MILATLCFVSMGRPQAAPSLLNRPAPAFAVKDLSGREISPGSLRGGSTVFFVFCSCRECKVVAEDWARIQKYGLLDRPAYRDGRPVTTLISYLGSPAAMKEFAKRTKLSKQTVFLNDPTMSIARDYRAMPCPTVFVLDREATVRYASKEQAGALVASSSILLGQTLGVLQSKTRAAKVPSSGPRVAALKPTRMLTGTIGADLEAPAPGELVWRPRGIDLNREQDLSRSFLFTNRAKEPISVSQVLASCGCQKAELIQNGKVVPTVLLKPGEAVTLRMRIHLTGNGEEKHVSAWLYSAAMAPVGSIRLAIGD